MTRAWSVITYHNPPLPSGQDSTERLYRNKQNATAATGPRDVLSEFATPETAWFTWADDTEGNI